MPCPWPCPTCCLTSPTTIPCAARTADRCIAACDAPRLHAFPHTPQLKQAQDDAARAQAEAEARAAARDEGPTKAQLSKLGSQLKLKDEMLRQLKAAIKALEAKLTQVMKEHADE